MKSQTNAGIVSWIKGLMFKRIHGMLSCREFEDFVLAYLDNELSEKQQKQFNLHLRLCRACRQYVQAYKRTVMISKSVFPSASEPVPENIPEDLVKAILTLRDNE